MSVHVICPEPDGDRILARLARTLFPVGEPFKNLFGPVIPGSVEFLDIATTAERLNVVNVICTAEADRNYVIPGQSPRLEAAEAESERNFTEGVKFLGAMESSITFLFGPIFLVVRTSEFLGLFRSDVRAILCLSVLRVSIPFFRCQDRRSVFLFHIRPFEIFPHMIAAPFRLLRIGKQIFLGLFSTAFSAIGLEFPCHLTMRAKFIDVFLNPALSTSLEETPVEHNKVPPSGRRLLFRQPALDPVGGMKEPPHAVGCLNAPILPSWGFR